VPPSRGAEQPGADCLLIEPGPFEQLLAGAEPVQEAVDRRDDETALILYTSGSRASTPARRWRSSRATASRRSLGVPTMYAALLHHAGADEVDTSTLDLCVSGGAAMPVEILRAFEEKFGAKVLEGYGLSETTAIASFNRPDMERKPGSMRTGTSSSSIARRR
jgi:acyl-coenzyme A synthetase/AMP-(fatty) acid ligase